MENLTGLHIGMRKIKSVLAVSVAFMIWQIIRVLLPQLEFHPIFAYIYAIVEMRDTFDKTKQFGYLRIKATVVGLVVGLVFVALSSKVCSYTDVYWVKGLIDFVLVIIATLTSLTIADITKCKNFCAIAAIITVICLISHQDENRYLYAFMRVVQTLVGVFSAYFVNGIICKRTEQNQ